jgi:hypothetical protein
LPGREWVDAQGTKHFERVIEWTDMAAVERFRVAAIVRTPCSRARQHVMTDDPRALDRPRLAKLLELAGSPNDHEALTAVRLAHTLVRNNGASWEDVLQPWGQLQVATDAARILYEENEALRRQVVGAPARDDDWVVVGSAQEQRKWALTLHAPHAVYLHPDCRAASARVHRDHQGSRTDLLGRSERSDVFRAGRGYKGACARN